LAPAGVAYVVGNFQPGEASMADVEMTLQEAAARLGVHYMTAYRYVRLGQLPARKVGNSWRVGEAAITAFIDGAAAASHSSAGVPGSAKVTSLRRRAEWPERFEARLLAGDSGGAWGVVESALVAGMEPSEVYLGVIAPAMTSIGERWERDEIEVAIEHRASGIVHRVIGRLGPRFVRRGRTRGAVVVGAPSGEQHSLPLAMMADLVRLAGYEVHDLGADVPPESFAEAAAAQPGLIAVGIGITTPGLLPKAAAAVAVVRERCPDVPVVLGGRAVASEELARQAGADAWAPAARDLVAFLDALTARRSRLRAGADDGAD
jgi:excisionase family DNA binding protein